MGATGTVGNFADANSADYFRLLPNPDRVRVTLPRSRTATRTVPATGERIRTTVRCTGPAQRKIDVDGNGVWISRNAFEQLSRVNSQTADRANFKRTINNVRRDAAVVNIVDLLNNNAANTLVAVIDMARYGPLPPNEWQVGGQTVRQNQYDVIRLAQQNDIPIYEVYCATAQTDAALRTVMTTLADGTPYNNYIRFQKPGTGGANDDNCIQEHPVVAPAPTFLNAIPAARTNVVVMGHDAAICVGRSIFGGWTRTRVAVPYAPLPDEQNITVEDVTHTYVGGILDAGKNVITSRRVLVADGNGALPTGYTYMG